MTNETPRSVRRATRLLSPAGFLLAGLFLLMPFVAVSCDAPGGFGRAAPGGATTYTGVDLITGGAPEVPADHLRPPTEQRDDRLGPQPSAIAAALLLVIGVVLAGIGAARTRRTAAAVAAALAAMLLVSNQATVSMLLRERLAAQLAVPIPAGHRTAEYVHDQGGFWLCLATLLVLAAVNAAGRLRLRRSAALDQPEAELNGGPSPR